MALPPSINDVLETRRRLGVLGGMGPLATIDFLDKLVDATPATRDQQHIPLVVRFCPEVPDRVDALLRGGPSPEPALVAAAQSLEQCGAECIAIPCNTAHFWHAAVQRSVSIPVMHIADAALDAFRQSGLRGPLGIVATAGTLAAGIYQKRDETVDWIQPTSQELATLVMPGIHFVKSGEVAKATPLLEAAVDALVGRGAAAVLLGCTEVPVALRLRTAEDGGILLDATDTLARACVRWATAGFDSPLSSPA